MLTAYEESLKDLWDLNNCLETARRRGREKGFAIGLAKGFAEGFAEGFAKGFAEGFAEGFVEGKSKVARTMKQAGISSEEISKFTGLPITTIENL